MSNGTITLGAHTYQAGEVAFLMDLRRYGMDGTHELRGDPAAPSLVFAGATTKPGHQFKFTAAFKYEPGKDVTDGVPYGFHFVGGLVGLADRARGMGDGRSLDSVLDLRQVVVHGEAYFLERERFAARATAAVDQAAAKLRDRGELR